MNVLRETKIWKPAKRLLLDPIRRACSKAAHWGQVPLAWCPGRNWGDALSPVLAGLLSGKKVVHLDGLHHARYLAIGSILGSANEHAAVWGSGFISNDGTVLGRPRAVHAVRGPLSRALLLKQGIECPEVYGDPALLLPLCYNPTVAKQYAVGIIPHYIDKGHPWLEQHRRDPQVMILDIESGIQEFVRAVKSCEVILSSSLHGLICADSYRVPNAWVQFSDDVIGGDFKFRDYRLSIGAGEPSPLRIAKDTELAALVGAARAHPLNIDLRRLILACPFLGEDLRCEVMEAGENLPVVFASTSLKCEPEGDDRLRVLHIVENFHGQAVESWLFRVWQRARERHPHLAFTFFCIVAKPSPVDEIIRQMGGEVIHTAYPVGKPLAFTMALRRVMRQGRYDVLHCHHDIMSALPLLAAMGLPFRQRIVQVHNTSNSLPTPNRLKIALVRPAFRLICLRADKIVGVSEYALDAMLGGCQRKAVRDCVIHCGIETARFQRDAVKADELRQSFGLGPDAKILLFVGRMSVYKNPNFVVEVLEHLQRADARFAAVFAGTGPYENEVRELARQKGLSGRVRVLGWRQDVPELMHACDLLIWPGIEEPKEGLGLGVVEAQAAGLPVVMSRNVPEEAVVVPELVNIQPLSTGPQAWAEAVSTLFQRPRPARREALAKVAASSFSIGQSADNIAALYAGDDREIR